MVAFARFFFQLELIMSISSDVQEFSNTSLAQNNAALLGQMSKLVSDSAENLKRSSVAAADEQMDTLEEAKSNLEGNAVEKVKASLSEGTSLLSDKQKLILLADKSEFGWKTVEEYTQHELADSEADGKKIRKDEERAEKALNSAASKKSVKRSISARRTSTLQYGPQNSRGSLRWLPGVTKMSSRHSLLLPFRQKMAIVLPVVSLATGDRNAPKFSVQDIKVIYQVTNDCMMVEKACLTILLIFPSVILPKFVPKYLYSKVRTLSSKV